MMAKIFRPKILAVYKHKENGDISILYKARGHKTISELEIDLKYGELLEYEHGINVVPSIFSKEHYVCLHIDPEFNWLYDRPSK